MTKTVVFNKREAILWAAVELMTENGFDKTSISQIANLAGVGKGTFYLYFQSKSELVLGIAKFIVDDLLKNAEAIAWNTKTSLKQFIIDITDLTYEITSKHKALIGFCYSGTAYYSAFNEWDELYLPYYQWLLEKLRFYQGRGDIATDYDLGYLSNYIVGLLEHGAEQYYLFEGVLSQAESNLEISKRTMNDFIYKALINR